MGFESQIIALTCSLLGNVPVVKDKRGRWLITILVVPERCFSTYFYSVNNGRNLHCRIATKEMPKKKERTYSFYMLKKSCWNCKPYKIPAFQ